MDRIAFRDHGKVENRRANGHCCANEVLAHDYNRNARWSDVFLRSSKYQSELLKAKQNLIHFLMIDMN